MTIISDELIMQRYDDLSASEIDSYEFPERVLFYLEETRQRLGLNPEQCRVLDFGCGRGRAVAFLRLRGYQAYGLEVDPQWIEFATPGFAAKNLIASDLIKISIDGYCPSYGEDYFHFVFSSSVFEHVMNLSSSVNEIARLTAPGGGGYHHFIAHHSLFEGHIQMPLIHWISPCMLTKKMVKLALRLGFDPKWKCNEGKSIDECAEMYYLFLRDEVRYRPAYDYFTTFEHSGLKLKYDILSHPKIKRGLLGQLTKNKLFAQVLEYICLNYFTVNFATKKAVHISGNQDSDDTVKSV